MLEEAYNNLSVYPAAIEINIGQQQWKQAAKKLPKP